MSNIISHKGVLAQSSIKCFNRLLLVLILSFQFACSKSEQSSNKVDTTEVKCTLFKEKLDEDSALVKVSFEITEGWHIYGPNTQKNGRPTKVEFIVGEESIAATEWPATKVFDEGQSGPSDGYDGRFDVSSKIEVKDNTLKTKVTWVACKDICVPGEAELSL